MQISMEMSNPGWGHIFLDFTTGKTAGSYSEDLGKVNSWLQQARGE